MRSLKLILVLSFIALSFFLVRSFVHPQSDPVLLESSPRCLAINPFTDQAVVVTENPDTLSIVDLKQLQVIAVIPAGKMPSGVAIDTVSNLVLLSMKQDNSLTAIDLNTYQEIATATVGSFPKNIAIHGESRIALVANSGSNSVSIIDLKTFTVIRTIPVGKGPNDIAVDPEFNLALVVNEKSDTVSVIDLETYQVAGVVPVGKKPQAVSINPETHLAAVANEKSNSLTVIDLQTWATTHLPLHKHPIDVAFNPLDNRVLAILHEDINLYQIDVQTKTVINEFPINKLTRGVAVNPFTNIAAVIEDKTDGLTIVQLPNPIPEITSITPETVLRGSKTLSVKVTGSGFLRTSNVSSFPVSFIDNRHLEVELPESLFGMAGSYGVLVTNPAPSGGPSNTVELNISNPAPSLEGIDPVVAVAGTPGITLTVSGTGFFPDTTFSINGMPRGFTMLDQAKIQIEITAEDLEMGKYIEIWAFNPSPGGGFSNPMRLEVLNPLPKLFALEPSSSMPRSPGLTLKLIGDSFVKNSIVSFNDQVVIPTCLDKNQLQVNLPEPAISKPGEYPIKVINPSPGGGESSSLTFTVKSFLDLAITSPFDGETIAGSKTLVSGKVRSDMKDLGITVNGFPADVVGDDWFANNVHLGIGSNTITAVATDASGNTTSKSIAVTATMTSPFITLASIGSSGVAPLPISFSVFTSNFTPVLYQMDFEGDGLVDFTGAAFDAIHHTYTKEGRYYPKILVSDDQGNTYSDTLAVTVLSKAEIDTILRNKWGEMKEALLKGDINKGASFFLDSSKETYRQAFNALSNELPEIISGMQDIEMIYLRDDVSKYRINRTHTIDETDQPITYYIYFAKDVEGIWKIDRF